MKAIRPVVRGELNQLSQEDIRRVAVNVSIHGKSCRSKQAGYKLQPCGLPSNKEAFSSKSSALLKCLSAASSPSYLGSDFSPGDEFQGMEARLEQVKCYWSQLVSVVCFSIDWRLLLLFLFFCSWNVFLFIAGHLQVQILGLSGSMWLLDRIFFMFHKGVDIGSH